MDTEMMNSAEFSLSETRRTTVRPHPSESSRASSRFGAAPLLVYLHLMLDAVVQLKVVVLQRGGGAGGEATVGAGAVEEQARADRPQQDAQGTHHDDGEEDGVQRVQPGVVLVLL